MDEGREVFENFSSDEDGVCVIPTHCMAVGRELEWEGMGEGYVIFVEKNKRMDICFSGLK